MRTMLAMLAASLVAVGVTAVATAAPTADANARCLRGQWRTTNVEANAYLQRLMPLPEMKVSRGVLTAGFGGGEMRYGSTSFQVALTTMPLVLRASASFVYEATYTVRGGAIAVGRGTSEVAISKFKATKDGKTVSVPGPAPTTRRIPAGTVPYTCVRNTLRLRPPVGAPDGAFITFQRVR